MAMDIRLPQINGKTDAERLQQITRYLYQLATDLNYKLSTLEAGTSDETSAKRNGTVDDLIGGKTMNIKVDAANITGRLKASQIDVKDLSALGATIGGFNIDHNSIHSAMKTDGRILICSGTSASYKVNGFTSTGWSILAGNKFGVLKDGTVYCEGAKINGSIETGVTSDDKQFGVKVGDGFIHVNSNAFKDIQSDGGQIYLLMKFNTEDGQTWGLFASGPYGEGGSIDLTDLFIERIDRLKAT